MKTFKQFINDKESILKFPSSFSEIKDKSKESILSWKSSHQENKPIKNKEQISESIPKISPDEQEWSSKLYVNDVKSNSGKTKLDLTYNDEFHDHPDIIPGKLTKEHKNSIGIYTSVGSKEKEGHGSSANMNGYLRNKLGDKTQGIYKHNEEDVKKSINTLSSAFTKENTNRKNITTYGGVPPEIGKKLMISGKGKRHTLSGFTSTSSSKVTAKNFADDMIPFSPVRNKSSHIIKYNIEPGAGLSAVHHSHHSENEVILHHGAHITYSHTLRTRDSDGHPLLIHHVTVHNTNKPLSEYGIYNHPND